MFSDICLHLLLHAGKASSGPWYDGGSWENELKIGVLLGAFGAEEEFLSPAWTTKRS